MKNEGVAIHHRFISEIASHLDLYLAIHFTYLLLKKDNLRVIDPFHRCHNLISCTVLSKDTLTITETHQLLVSFHTPGNENSLDEGSESEPKH